MTEIKYNCFAEPPYGISIDRIYLFGHDSKGYFYSDKNKNYLSLNEIKMLFVPIKGDWNSVLKAETKVEKTDNKE